MWIRQLITVLSLTVSLAAASCASTRDAAGKCEDYKPLAACSLDFQYVCETNEDGCEQCSCVPKGESRNGVGPERPYDPFAP
ncbi:MAG: hypothetical protein CVU56_20740 [Deltaproteobacteria bacterium HGW-Deltaproteobacteria-14]|jgi:hypothetical protein|nr:MAG: hypothetical protein CVU56_20740 [Deltaproteobacteria bacterium HGW-Deltaproteobacteria-14]